MNPWVRLLSVFVLAVAAFGQANLIEHPNLFYAVAIVQPGRSRRPRVVSR